MIGPENGPSAEHEAHVDERRADDEAHDVGHGSLQRENEDVVVLEKAEVAEHAEPNEEVPETEEESAEVPQVPVGIARLDHLLDHRPDDDQDVVDAYHNVPAVQKEQLLFGGHVPAESFPEEPLCPVLEELCPYDGSETQYERHKAEGNDEVVEELDPNRDAVGKDPRFYKSEDFNETWAPG